MLSVQNRPNALRAPTQNGNKTLTADLFRRRFFEIQGIGTILDIVGPSTRVSKH